MNEELLQILEDERSWVTEARITSAGGWRSRVHVRLQLRALERQGLVESQKAASERDGRLWRRISPAAAAVPAKPALHRAARVPA